MTKTNNQERFKLIGRDLEFVVQRRYNIGSIACVHGITPDNKKQTHARVADIVWID